MTEIKMLRNFRISLDGINVDTWRADDVKMVDDETLRLLIGEGACEIVENKAHMAAPENKGRGRPRKVKA